MSGAKVINNPNGAYGVSDANQKLSQQVMEFKASAAIAGGPQVVALGTDGRVAEAATDSTASLSVGITTGNVASGDIAQVVVYGFVGSVPAAGAITAGAILKRSVTTTGSVSATASPAAGEAIGFAVAASASNLVDVWVCKAL